MLKKLILSLTFVWLSFSAFSQLNCKTNAVVSVNAYYDSYRILSFVNDPDTCKAIEVLRLLPAYSAEDGSYEFEDHKLSQIYERCLNYIFSLNKIVEYFERPVETSGVTGRISEFVKQHKKYLSSLQNDSISVVRVEEIDVDSIVKAVFASEVFVTADSTQKQAAITQALRNILTEYPFINDALPDSLHISIHEDVLLTNLEEIRAGVIRNIRARMAATNLKLTKNAAALNNYFVKNFRNVDANFASYLVGRNANNDIYSTLSNEISLGITSLQNASADSFYYKNETYSLTNFKLPTQTEMIDALAIYLARRFKQEVALTLVDQFRKILKNDKLINELFPETYKMFATGKVYEMPTFGSAWNYAISKDFSNLLTNLSRSTYVQNRIGDSILTGHLQDVVKMCNLINKRFSYIDVVSQLYNDENLKSEFFKKNIQTLYIINKELFDTTHSSRFWITAEQLYSMKSGQMQLVLALIKSKYKHRPGVLDFLESFDDQKVRRLQNSISSLLLQLNNFQAEQRKLAQMSSGIQTIQVSNYWNFLHSIFEAITVINPNAIDPKIQRCINVTNYAVETYSLLTEKNYAGAALKITEILPAIKAENYIDIKNLVISAKELKRLEEKNSPDVNSMNSRFDFLDKTLQDFLFLKALKYEVDTSVRDFRRLMHDSRVQMFLRRHPEMKNCNNMSCLTVLLRNDSIASRQKIEKAKASIMQSLLVQNHRNIIENDIDKAVEAITDKYHRQEVREYINSRSAGQFDAFRKLSGFLSDMMMAGSSKNLSLVIEKYALPPNSYKIKRASRWSWDLNAYVGTYIGREIETPYNKISEGGWVWGLSAPIGVSYSWGTTRKKGEERESPFTSQRNLKPLTGNSWTFTVSVIDIGAVVSYRLGNSSEGLPQKVQWAQLLSPGAHIRYGLKNTPICFSMGIQHSPQLRRLKEDAPLSNTLRTYLGAFFDLPLFNITHDRR